MMAINTYTVYSTIIYVLWPLHYMCIGQNWVPNNSMVNAKHILKSVVP